MSHPTGPSGAAALWGRGVCGEAEALEPGLASWGRHEACPRLRPHSPVPLREGQHLHQSGALQFLHVFPVPQSLPSLSVLNFTNNQGALLWAPFCPHAHSTYVQSPVTCLKHYEAKHRPTCSNLAQYPPGGETGATPFSSLCLSLPTHLGVTCCYLVWTGNKTQ